MKCDCCGLQKQNLYDTQSRLMSTAMFKLCNQCNLAAHEPRFAVILAFDVKPQPNALAEIVAKWSYCGEQIKLVKRRLDTAS